MKLVEVIVVFVLTFVSVTKASGVTQNIRNASSSVIGSEAIAAVIQNHSSAISLHNQSLQSCMVEPSKQSGKYLIQPAASNISFLGYCEQDTFGGGWLVFQYRYDGSVDFFRGWTDYRNGFGNLDGEFWLGLEHLHQLTSARPHELLVELKDYNGRYKYARYDSFQIASELGQYALKKLGKHTGTAVDALDYQKGMMFSTKDRDNDPLSEANCAYMYRGAWWYNQCAKSNLNGLYVNSNFAESMDWDTIGSTSHAYTRMLIREK